MFRVKYIELYAGIECIAEELFNDGDSAKECADLAQTEHDNVTLEVNLNGNWYLIAIESV